MSNSVVSNSGESSSSSSSDSDAETSGPQRITSSHEDVGCFAVVAWILGFCGVYLFVASQLTRQHDSELFWVGLVCYLIYLMELCFGKACTFLSNVCSEKEFVEYIESLQKAKPIITFTIQNYHYEEDTHYDSDTKHHRTTRRRVDTHKASQSFPIGSFTDETFSPAQTVAMFHLLHQSAATEDSKLLHEAVTRVKETGEQRLILTCRFPISFLPRDADTASYFTTFREEFYARNSRDEHQDISEKHELSCTHNLHAMVVLSSRGTDVADRPWWMSRVWLIISTLLLVGLPFRCYLFRSTQKVVWRVRKHFSIHPPSAVAAALPIHSLKLSPDATVSRIAHMDPKAKIAFKEGGFWELPQAVEEDVELDIEAMAGSITADAPHYWTQQDMHSTFRCVETLENSEDQMQAHIQQLLDDCFLARKTRDRSGRLPTRLVVEMIQRVEDSELWKRYAEKRGRIALERDEATRLEDLPGSGGCKTARSLGYLNRRLDSSINELYLFHGSDPAGVLGIGTTGFKLDLAGSRTGLMFGPGAYFAEASSKCDEYASEDPSGLFAGKCALLLCRVACGELFRVEHADQTAIQKAQAEGYDGILGDREAAVGTFREFVVHDEAQVYPEYVVIYRRSFG
mmetsp:Transcript_37817/g.87547  ORF Transcript_37817/g.87547 Transcript_37817/m.87547 type:complete len:628 (-) Transcript_37817:184-2067(-)